MRFCCILTLYLLCGFFAQAQGTETKEGSPKLLPTVIDRRVGDTIPYVYLPEVFVFPELRFKNKKEEQNYNKLVRDVKRTLPYAKMVYNTLIETYEYMETLPDDKARQKHLKRMEKDMFQDYKPELKKLTLSQGKLLIKLIDRECNQSSFNILKAYLGSFRASFWNIFAGVFGASLKSEYDPKGKDALTERVVIMVEKGLI
jgi:hypothetical protein